jgi:hypothetical protein
MAKRNLRVVKWLGTVPAVGACTYCNREFKVPLTVMKRVAALLQSRTPQVYLAFLAKRVSRIPTLRN